MNAPKRPALLLASLAALFVSGLSLHAAEPAPAASLIPNSNFETDANSDQWPDGWPRLKTGGSWETEDGNRFLRLVSTAPGQTVMLYREIKIPADVHALKLTWRQRVTGLRRGAQPWFDARIMMEFLSADRTKVGASPKPQATGMNTDGWVERSATFAVPDGAVFLKFMPSLFQVDAGTFDLDDIVLTPVDQAP